MAITALTSAVGCEFLFDSGKSFFGRDERNCANHATLLYTNLGIHINTGIFILFLNIPVFILGFVKIRETINDS